MAVLGAWSAWAVWQGPSPLQVQGGDRIQLAGPDLYAAPEPPPRSAVLLPPWSRLDDIWVRDAADGASIWVCDACWRPWPGIDTRWVETAAGTVDRLTLVHEGSAEPVDERWMATRLESALELATVHIERADGTQRACGWAFGRFYCGPDAWNWVGLTDLKVRERTESCIWAHPTQEGTIVLSFAGLPATQGIRGWAALADVAVETERDAQIRVDVALNDGPTEGSVATFEFEQGRQTWRASAPAPGSGTTALTLRISATDVGMAHFCIAGELEPLPDEPDDAVASPGARALEQSREERQLERRLRRTFDRAVRKLWPRTPRRSLIDRPRRPDMEPGADPEAMGEEP